jgi:ubiquinone/menaquinone biosynthesis C-methylase UbiE
LNARPDPTLANGASYARAGVDDVAEFYRTKFLSDEVLDHRYFAPLNRFDLRFARTLWVYDNVRHGASLLDLGCGPGMLALLKRKDVTLTGVDLSEECVAAARRNGYDTACCGPLVELPFADASFDYVASLDVLGHIPFEDKDAVLREIKRVLRPGGVTLHGIEATDRAVQRGYDELTPAELAKFVAIDGHVGLEEEDEHAARFARFFAHVAWEPRFGLCLSSAEFLKQADGYGARFEPDWLEYLRGLSFAERRAFDMAMGYVFAKISDLGLRLPRSGFYVLLKASDLPLGPMYNEHRDRRELLAGAPAPTGLSLDRDPRAVFDDGWYEANDLPPRARWLAARGRVTFAAPRVAALRLHLTTHIPELASRPLTLRFLFNGAPVHTFTLASYGWRALEIEVPEALRQAADGLFELEIRASRTWRPRPDDPVGRDDRDLSVAICNLEALP